MDGSLDVERAELGTIGSCSARTRTKEVPSLERQIILQSLIAFSSPDSIKSLQTTRTASFTILVLLAGPIGLLGNLASIIALCDPWRKLPDGSTIADSGWTLAINAVALGMGCLANFLLGIHAYRFVSALWGLFGSCVLYMIAVCLYMGALGRAESLFNSEYHRSAGYWQAVCGSVLYFVASLMLCIHLIERRWQGLPKGWDRDRQLKRRGLALKEHILQYSQLQRHLMLLFVAYLAWIAMGAAVSAHVIGISYANGAYYCIVTCLTLGYGDIVSHDALGRALTIPYLYVGLILGAFTTIFLFQASFSSARRQAVSNYVERKRLSAFKNMKFETEQDAFDNMRSIVQASELRTSVFRSTLTISWLSIFWLLGALVFKYTEGWSYFDSFYMCATSLASVGFGDFVPTSTGGRSFFLHWALLAVPTMTTAVSDLVSVFMTSSLIVSWQERLHKQHKDRPSLFEEYVVTDAKLESETWHRMVEVSRDSDTTQYSFDVWHELICLLLNEEPEPSFWVSDASPLRIPFLNEKKFMLLAFLQVLPYDSAGSGKPKDAELD